MSTSPSSNDTVSDEDIPDWLKGAEAESEVSNVSSVIQENITDEEVVTETETSSDAILTAVKEEILAND